MEDIGFEGEYTFWCDILKTINTLFEDNITMQEYISGMRVFSFLTDFRFFGLLGLFF